MAGGVVTVSEHELSEIRGLIETRSGILFDDSRERFFSTRVMEHVESRKLNHVLRLSFCWVCWESRLVGTGV